MKHNAAFVALALLAAPLNAQEPAKPVAPAPGEIVAAAPAKDWAAIPASDLLIMDLASDAKGTSRRVVIQLMLPRYSAGWIGNIRILAAAHWWDGTSVNRVQDNYVVQWGDASEKKALPSGLASLPESAYMSRGMPVGAPAKTAGTVTVSDALAWLKANSRAPSSTSVLTDIYAPHTSFWQGWPLAFDSKNSWPVHCYGMVGVGRDLPPNTGTGAELYAVIGHAPRHLDRNIAIVGRVIEGIEHLSALPRGTGALGFYKTVEERVPIKSVRLGNDVKDLPKFEYLSTESKSFAAYADARANRRDAFFIRPSGGADICNIPVPVRRIKP